MSFTRPLVVAAFLAVSATVPLRAQEAPAQPADAPRHKAALNQNVRVEVTISLKADGKPLTKKLSMVTGDGKTSQGRAGIEIPVPSGHEIRPGASGPTPTGFDYRDVSVNVDAIPQILDANHVLLRLKLSFSTVYKTDGAQGSQPSFGKGSHDAFGIVMDSGKPIVVTEAADGETGREYSVEVKATILK
ncbi:MAG: hypothetical protein ABIT71_01455 [Vicinamibacteraceae bacterium]